MSCYQYVHETHDVITVPSSHIVGGYLGGMSFVLILAVESLLNHISFGITIW